MGSERVSPVAKRIACVTAFSVLAMAVLALAGEPLETPKASSGGGLPPALLKLLSTACASPTEQPQAGVADGIEAGVRLVEEGDFEKGIVVLDAAVRQLRGPETGRLRARGYVYLGIAYLGLAQMEAAKERFRAALGEAADLTLSAYDYPPRVVDLFEQARREMRNTPALGRPLAVVPEGSRVRLRSRDTGDIRGVVVAIDQTSLTLGSEGGAPMRVPLSSIETMHQIVGRRSNTIRGLVIGAASGALLGLTFSTNANDCGAESLNFCSRAEAVGGGVLTGALFGVAVGALTRHDVWAPVTLEVSRTGSAAGRKAGVRAALGFRF
jgi:hypothetical protein